jgi:hypothetical protein
MHCSWAMENAAIDAKTRHVIQFMKVQKRVPRHKKCPEGNFPVCCRRRRRRRKKSCIIIIGAWEPLKQKAKSEIDRAFNFSARFPVSEKMKRALGLGASATLIGSTCVPL